MNISLTMARIKHWGLKGGMAILDQGVFSGSNFILNILLARWLLPEEYGAFSISFTIYLFLTGFYIALVLEPASVLGPSHYADDLGSYLNRLFKLHFILCFFLSILMLGAALVLLVARVGGVLFAFALLGNGASLTFTLFLWFVRRLFYILLRPEFALIGSVVFSVMSIGGVYASYLLHGISVFGVFVITGFASVVGAVFSLWIGRGYFAHAEDPKITWMETLSEQWRFGKWRTLGSFLAITFGQMQTFFVAGILGLPAVGALRALQNFVLPMIQLETAIESLGLSSVSSEYAVRNFRAIRAKSFLIALSLLSISSLYLLLLFRFARPLQNLLFFDKYSDYVGLVPILGLLPIFLALAMGFTLPLLSIGRSKYYLIVYAVNAPISIFSAFLLTKNYGVTGSVVSILVPSIVNLIVAAVLFYFWFPRR
jgi:O-antigen/teichoic acid export membrane protein